MNPTYHAYLTYPTYRLWSLAPKLRYRVLGFTHSMALQPGQSLAHYRIDRLIGEGGMGEVWAATDTRLNRPAAIKALPAAVAADPQRLARFHREAQVLAALNHPNIAGIYGLEQHDGVPYLAMELVDGQDLSARIDAGPIPVAEAVEFALQIAAALDEAHAKGIVHRDLKPANVMVTPSGTVKVLDFGLAKALEPGEGGVDDGRSAGAMLTMTSPAVTAMGLILGTASYMSPEQARGKPVDRRADIWAFGVVLLEMLTGRRAFTGDTVTDVIAAVVTREPDWSRLPADVPVSVRHVLQRCLQKDPRKRLRDIGDAALELAEPAADVAPSERTTAATPAPARRGWLLAAGGVVVGVVATLVGAGLLSRGEASPTPTWSTLPPPTGTTYDFTRFVEISPDGRRVAFVAPPPQGGEPLLWVRDLASERPRMLAGTEGARQPFWSPDSASIGYFAGRRLRRIPADGGVSTDLADAGDDPRGACWGEDGTILFIPDWSRPVYRIPVSGGTPEAVTEFDAARFDMSHRWPQFLPDGRHFLFFLVSTYPALDPARPSPVDQTGLYVGSLDGGPPRLVHRVRSRATYVDGSLVFVDKGVLMARPFDLATLSFTGDATPIAEGVTQAVDAVWGSAQFSVSRTGTLLFVRGGRESRALLQLEWRDRAGKILGTIGEPRPFNGFRLSGDGRRLAMSIDDPGDIWVHDFERGTATRFTFDTGHDELPVWSPRDQRILFHSNRVVPGVSGMGHLFQKGASGAAPEEYLMTADAGAALQPSDWSPDGRHVALTGLVPGVGSTLMIYSVEDRTLARYRSAAGEANPMFSPDGRWLAYVTTESGTSEVFVESYPASGAKWQVSSGGGTAPVWRADGRELLYAGQDGVMAVPVETGEEFRHGRPVRLFAFDFGTSYAWTSVFSVTPDGKRFLVLAPVDEAPPPDAGVTLLQHWRTIVSPRAR